MGSRLDRSAGTVEERPAHSGKTRVRVPPTPRHPQGGYMEFITVLVETVESSTHSWVEYLVMPLVLAGVLYGRSKNWGLKG